MIEKVVEFVDFDAVAVAGLEWVVMVVGIVEGLGESAEEVGHGEIGFA